MKFTQQDFKIMRTFEEIVAEIIWQNENVSKENAVRTLQIAFCHFTVETASVLQNENLEASNLFYSASRKIREAMETQPQV